MDEKKSFDIGSLAAADEAELQILDGDGRKTGWTMTFAGPSHPVTVAIDNEQNAMYVAREQAKDRARTNGRKWKGDDDTPEELRERAINYIATRLLRWSPMTMDGADFPCTPENVRKLLADRRFGLVYDQANSFLIEEKSFTKRSPKA